MWGSAREMLANVFRLPRTFTRGAVPLWVFLTVSGGLLCDTAIGAEPAGLDAASCKNDPRACIARCEAALNGFNDALKSPWPDVQAIEGRARAVNQCDRLSGDDDLAAQVRSEITALLDVQYSADAESALGCYWAIDRSASLSPGSVDYKRNFELTGCGRYARAIHEQAEDRRTCELEKTDFERSIQSDDLAFLRAADSRLKCREYRGQLFSKIETLRKSAETAAEAEDREIAQPGERAVDVQQCVSLARAWRGAHIDETADYVDKVQACDREIETVEVLTMVQEVEACASGLRRLRQSSPPSAVELSRIGTNCRKLEQVVALRIQELQGGTASRSNADASAASAACANAMERTKALIDGGSYAAILKHVEASGCESLQRELPALAGEVCALQAVGFANHLLVAGETAENLKRRYDCPGLAARIDERFAKLAEARQQASVCADEGRELDEVRSSYDALTGFSRRLSCERLRPVVAGALSALCAREAIVIGRFAEPANGTLNEYEEARAKAQCPEMRGAIVAAIDAMQGQDVCRGEAEALSLIRSTDLASLLAFKSRSECGQLAGRLDRLITDARSILICKAEQERLASIGYSDIDGLRDFRKTAKCQEAVTLVEVRLVEAGTKRQCDAERGEFERLKEIGSPFALKRFELRLECDDLRANVADAIEVAQRRRAAAGEAQVASLDPDQVRPGADGVTTGDDHDVPQLPDPLRSSAPQPTMSDTQIYVALQRQLERLGCYKGDIDGIFGGGSRRALQAYQAAYTKSSGNRDLDLALLEELRNRREIVPCETAPAARPGDKTRQATNGGGRIDRPGGTPRASGNRAAAPVPGGNAVAPAASATPSKPPKVNLGGISF